MRQRNHRWLLFMKRRALITFFAGLIALPMIANAQLPKQRRIGVLSSFSESEARNRERLAFRKRLEELGWQGGRDIEIEYRWAEATLTGYRRLPRSWSETARTFWWRRRRLRRLRFSQKHARFPSSLLE